LKYLKGRRLRSIKRADIERIKAGRMKLLTPHGRPRSASTIVKELSVLSGLFSLAIDNDCVEYNPVGRVSKPRIDNLQDKILFETDEAKFLAAFQSDWCRDICELILNTGLSQKDALNLTKFNINLQRESIVFTRSKTTQHVEVPLNAIALKIVQDRMALSG